MKELRPVAEVKLRELLTFELPQLLEPRTHPGTPHCEAGCGRSTKAKASEAQAILAREDV